MAKPIRTVVVLSDLHCGSTFGLLPPGLLAHDQNPMALNPVQEWLWACWLDATGRWLPSVVGADRYALVLNGDLVEGVHHGTKEIVSAEVADHQAAAMAALGHLKPAKTYVVEGTEVHSNNREHGIAAALKAVPDPDTGKRAWPRLTLTVAGTRCCFFHHISTTSRAWLEASALGIYLANEQLEAARAGEPLPAVMGCAHRHRWGYYEGAGGLAFVTPPWQLCTRYARRVVPSARTRPGMVVLDWRDRRDGELPEKHVITYGAPQAKGATL